MTHRRSVFDALAERPEAQQRYRESQSFRDMIDVLDKEVQKGSDLLEGDEEYANFLTLLHVYVVERRWKE